MAGWLASHIDGIKGFASPFTTMGIIDDDAMVAVVLFNNYHPDSGVIEMHGASENKRWLTKRSIYEMFSYVFEQLKCQMAVMRVSEKDKRLHRILTSYGFKNHYIPRLRGRNEGEHIFTLEDDVWRSNGFHKEHV